MTIVACGFNPAPFSLPCVSLLMRLGCHGEEWEVISCLSPPAVVVGASRISNGLPKQRCRGLVCFKWPLSSCSWVKRMFFLHVFGTPDEPPNHWVGVMPLFWGHLAVLRTLVTRGFISLTSFCAVMRFLQL
jgi:hypothetical protein